MRLIRRNLPFTESRSSNSMPRSLVPTGPFSQARCAQTRRWPGWLPVRTLQSGSQIGNLILTARDGRPVYVRDLAEIELATAPREILVANVTIEDGIPIRAPALTIAIAKRPGTNAVVIAHRIVDKLEALKGDIVPDDVHLAITRDYGESANEKANELLFSSGAGNDLHRSSGRRVDRVARSTGRCDRHPDDHSSDPLFGSDHGLYIESGQPIRPYLLHRYPG